MRLKITLHEEREELDRMEARKWWGKNQIQAKMSDNEVNGPEDAVVSEIIKQLPKRKYTSSRSAFRNASWARWKHQVRGEIVKLVFFWKTRCGTEEGNQKLQGHCAVCFSSFGNREWTWELEEFTRGRNWRHQLPTLSSHDDKFVAETLGVAGGQKTKDEARQCETTHDILGEHGHQDGFSTWRDRSTLHELWRIIIVNVIVSPGYECYTSVTCSTWSELGSTDTENGTRVNKTVGLWMERVQTGWLLFVMAQQQGSQHCLRNRHWLQWYQSRAGDKTPQNVYKAKEALISQTCPWSGWLDDVARLQSENRISCQVTVGVGVTDIDVSSTWTSKKERATVQGFKPLPGWSSIQEGGTRISWRNCQKFAHKLSWRACTWHELDDPTFCGRSTSLRDQTKIDSGMWQTMSKADFLHSSHKRFPTMLSCGKHGSALSTGFYVKTQTLLATLRTRNQPLGESYASSEVEHLSPSVGWSRSKHQYPTVLRSLKPFLWMLDCAWMEYLLSIFGTW